MREKSNSKKSTVRHTRAIQRDRTKRQNSAPPDEEVEALLAEILHPALLNQTAYFHELGLRERLLNLPVMMAFALSLVWRHLGSVTEAVRVLKREGLLWVEPVRVSQQAVEQRLRSLPADLFPACWRTCCRRCKPAGGGGRAQCRQRCGGRSTALRLW